METINNVPKDPVGAELNSIRLEINSLCEKYEKLCQASGGSASFYGRDGKISERMATLKLGEHVLVLGTYGID